ncbi:MAG: hypothetical protein AAF821_22555 [Cyanobacteria bacterium P01_D01_bin.156]
MNNPIFEDRVWSSPHDRHLDPWKMLFQAISQVWNMFVRFTWEPFAMVNQSSVQDYASLEVLPDYYLNCDSAKRLWQDWRVLKRLFTRRDHSRDLLLQGQSGWLPIHGMAVHRQSLTVSTDEGKTVLDLNEPVVWLSRANPANTKIVQEPIQLIQKTVLWNPA